MLNIALTQFARKRLFPTDGRLEKIQGVSAAEFEAYVNQHEPEALLDGYAPFCKLAVYKNWTDTRLMAVPITDENRAQLRSAYEARMPKELPVLTRWLEGIEPPVARYLLVILYSREQMQKEQDPVDADWGVVGCLGTLKPEETPIQPITMMRNALGVEEGGSGVSIDRNAYQRAVDFWSQHAVWRSSPARSHKGKS